MINGGGKGESDMFLHDLLVDNKFLMENYSGETVKLSSKELMILYHLSMGMRTKDIEKRIKISHRTIENHISRMMIKFRARNRADLICALLSQFSLKSLKTIIENIVINEIHGEGNLDKFMETHNKVSLNQCKTDSHGNHCTQNKLKKDSEVSNNLTSRELECLYWTANGKSAEEIALILGIVPSTVRQYNENVKLKLECFKMTNAIYKAMKLGILS